MFSKIISFSILLLVVGSSSLANTPWKLIWSDEFNGPNGSQVDPTKWLVENAPGEQSNNELEYYTSRPQNVFIQDGNLVIQSLREDFKDPQGHVWNYTSARLSTAKKFEPTYGKFEARIKIPTGQGIWPAFWMLGSNVDQVGWPQCGEIDIMETPGNQPTRNYGTLVGPGYYNGSGLGGIYTMPKGQELSDDYHIYAVEWDMDEVRFYFDNQLYSTVNKKEAMAKGQWVANHPFYMILNTAIGGYWPGAPDATSVFPQKMFVDYVRVYQR